MKKKVVKSDLVSGIKGKMYIKIKKTGVGLIRTTTEYVLCKSLNLRGNKYKR